MLPRIIDFSDRGARLRVRLDQLLITPDGGDDCSVPLAEVAVLIAAHPQVTFTQAVLSGLASAGGIFIVCDERRLPAGMLLPLCGHHLQTRRFQAQIAAAAPVKKRLWKQIVLAKIEMQAQALEVLHGASAGLRPLIPLVRSGDPENVEARAARLYWPLLFADDSFRRDREAVDQNRLLNYGYAVLRAVVARALCAAGLHPTLGLHHHNQYSAFCLADDLMEPFRPVVDTLVARLVREQGETPPLDTATKAALIDALLGVCRVDGQVRTLFDAAAVAAQSLAAVLLGEARRLTLPQALAVAELQ
jgi:CRISPR-associated protein Cas1